MSKIIGLLTVCALACMLLAGCASNADMAPSPSPGTMPSTSPSASAGTQNTPDIPATNGVDGSTPTQGGQGSEGQDTPESALKASKAVKDSVARLTEVGEATALVVDNMALVGLTYDSQYKGETDERMRGMVLTRAQTVDKSIESVKVTSDPEQVKQIEALYKQLEDGASLDTISASAKELASSIEGE